MAGAHRRALILSGSIGMGHDTVAQACTTSLAEHGWETATYDAIALLGGGASRAADRAFRRILAIPPLYDALYYSALRTGKVLARAMDWAAATKSVPAVEALIDEHEPDLIISVFATAASVVSQIKKERPELVSIVLCTDVTAHRLWVHEGTDLFLVTSEVARRSVQRFRPEAQVAVVPTPMRSSFYEPLAREEARIRLGVPEGETCVLLMAGGWGLGPIAAIARSLAESGFQVLAVAGQNKRLLGELKAVSVSCPQVTPFGFTERVSELMAACDLVVTSPGNTCFEARAIGRTLLLLDIVPGHGRDNLQHELELGNAYVSSGHPDSGGACGSLDPRYRAAGDEAVGCVPRSLGDHVQVGPRQDRRRDGANGNQPAIAWAQTWPHGANSASPS